jgi:5'-3' exonuclease
LLAHFGDLDSLLARIDEVQFLRFRGAAQAAVKLREHRDNARLFRQLTTIACDAPLGDGAPRFHRGSAEPIALGALCDTLRFGPMTRRRVYTAGGLDFSAHAPQSGDA